MSICICIYIYIYIRRLRRGIAAPPKGEHKLVLLYILNPRAPPNQWGSASKSDFVFTLSANGNTGLNPWVEKTHSSPPYRGWVVGKLERLVVKKPIFDQVP